MPNNSYPLKGFERYIKNCELNLSSDSSIAQYKTYLRKVLELLPDWNFLEDVRNILSFSDCHNPAEAIAYVNKAIHEIDSFKVSERSKEASDCSSALKCYQRYISYICYTTDYRQLIEDYKSGLGQIPANTPRLMALSTAHLAGTIDAMTSLVSAIGGPLAFVRLAIENCYFINKKYADSRFATIASKKDLYARMSAGKQKPIPPITSLQKGQPAIFQDGPYSVQITCDGNGNAKVCSLVNNATGYNIGAKYHQKIIKDYIISHIWGNATDPRYFTNFWNIVLVPAWANHLLDKNPQAGTLASVFKSTIMKICHEYYDMKSYPWKSLSMSIPAVGNTKDIANDTYKIRVIQSKSPGQIVGNITSVSIKV